MDIRFDGKRALVTGAGAGIGRGIVKGLVECGAETYALSKTLAHLQSLKEELPAVHIVQADLTDWEQTRKAVESIGPIDLLVNNAAVLKLSSFLDVTPDEIDETFSVNVKAVYNVSQVVCKGMVQRESGGSVVNISSIGSSICVPNHSVYCPSKSALDGLTRAMAMELGQHKIRVNSVQPTVVLTEMGKKNWSDPVRSAGFLKDTPLGKFAEVEDVVDATLFLLSDKATMIHGTALPVDGGRLVH